MNPINQEPNAQYLVYTGGQPNAAKPKKKQGCLIAFLIAAGVFILACAVATPFVLKEVKYLSAEACLSADDYDSAVIIFESLGTYKGSDKRITDVRYRQARYLAENKKYDDAVEILLDIASYEDSEELIEEYAVNQLDALIEEKSYNELEDYIDFIADDLDSSDKLEEACNYCDGVVAYHNRKYKEAAEKLYELGDYKESEKYYAMAAHYYYCNEFETVNKKETVNDIFNKLEKYKNSEHGIDKMLADNAYISMKIYGEWKSKTGESMILTDSEVKLNFPVDISGYKDYYVAFSGSYFIAVNRNDSNEIIPIFQVKSFDKPDVAKPDTLTIINCSDKKEYVFNRVG